MTKIRPKRLALLAILLFGCGESTPALAPAEPKALPPTEVAKIVRALPSYAHFSVSGVAYLDTRLFVATNIGLLEIQGKKLI